MKKIDDYFLSRLEAVLFDMDGVLLDSMAAHCDAWKAVLQSYGVHVTDQFIYENEGDISPEILKNLFSEHCRPFSKELSKEIYYRQNEKFTQEYLSGVDLYPETSTLLKALKRKGLDLALVTGSRRNIIERIWQPEDLSLFSTTVSADDTERYKPNPDPYLKAVSDLGLPTEKCLVVENAPAGIRAAIAAGITCFAVASTLPPEKLSSAQKVFPNLTTLKEYLMKFFS